MTEPLPAFFLRRLAEIFGKGALCTDLADCWTYGYDNSKRHALPQAVVFATEHAQVEAVLRLCNELLVPLTVRGRGTGTTGASVPVRGGLVLSLERMNRVLEFAPDDRYLVVEPGLTNQALQDHLKPAG
ncbi:MAG TPA: FAD-binding oxidoreductase, partial [Methylococcaceae bacterium]|nr:FAD-binding oxidoreductase [Methylococcaceae bacterium]